MHTLCYIFTLIFEGGLPYLNLRHLVWCGPHWQVRVNRLKELWPPGRSSSLHVWAWYFKRSKSAILLSGKQSTDGGHWKQQPLCQGLAVQASSPPRPDRKRLKEVSEHPNMTSWDLQCSSLLLLLMWKCMSLQSETAEVWKEETIALKEKRSVWRSQERM